MHRYRFLPIRCFTTIDLRLHKLIRLLCSRESTFFKKVLDVTCQALGILVIV